MKRLVILGKGELKASVNDYHDCEYEVWALGTSDIFGADRYFELHSIPCKHEKVTCRLDDGVYEAARESALPVNNSVCGMLIEAWLEGYEKIIVDGCPMNLKYEDQKAALAMVVGFLKGRGLDVIWTHAPENIEYGR